MMRTSMMVTVAALALAGCGSKTENAQAPAGGSSESAAMNEAPVTPAPVATAPGQAFANTAAASDAFEIATSNLALEKGQSSAVKKFAQSMVKAHTESTTKLKAAASSAPQSITPDPTLTPAQQQKLDALRGQTGAEFDKAYAAEQVTAHQTTLEALRSYAAKPDVPALGEFATQMVPIVTAHLNMAKSLKP